MTISVSIGILAHNAEKSIVATMESLAGQSIFTDPEIASLYETEIIIVANGCSDNTVSAAESVVAKCFHGFQSRVGILDRAGKSNAWNEYVHDMSKAGADALILMDADIVFTSDNVLYELLRHLFLDGSTAVVTDIPLKGYPPGTRPGLADRLSKRRSNTTAGGGNGICGQLYIARADVLKRIWLPINLPVEDGFIAAMVMTDGFTRQPVASAIRCIRHVSHSSYDEPGFGRLTRHEARLVVGSVINAWLFTLLWEAGKSGHAGEYVRSRNRSDRDWVDRACADERQKTGRWLIPASLVFRRLGPMRRGPLLRRVRNAPLAILATIATIPALLQANAILRNRDAERFW